MSVIGDFVIPAEDFALGDALGTDPEMTVEADRLASHSPREVFPFLWATGGDFEAFGEALAGDPSIEEVDVADESDDAVLYRLVWGGDFCELIHEMVDHHAAILEATAQADAWNLTLRFSAESMVTRFQKHFQETGREFQVNHLSRPSEPRQREYGLTAEQYETLVAASRAGYFHVPRDGSVEDLSAELGVSANAVSQRLRRGSDTLIRNALTIREDAEDS